MRGVREECARRRRPPGGHRVVRGVLRPADEPLGVGGRVVQRPALLVHELRKDVVEQEARELQPHPLARHRGQREEALGHVGVVLQHPRVGAGLPVLRGAGEPRAGVHVEAYEKVSRAHGRRDEVRPVEVRPGLGQRGDREAVPGGDDLVVPAGRGPLGTGGEEPLTDRGEPGGIRHRAVQRGQLEYGGALLEGALLRHAVAGHGQLRVGLAQHLTQLPRRPYVVRALDVLARGRVLAVGVERGGEPALVRAQFADHELRGLQGDAPGEIGAGGAPQVGVRAAEQGVVVQHLLEVRHDPLAVDGVAGEAAAELVVDAAARHPLAGLGGHLEGALGAGAGVVPQQELDDHGRRELGRAAEAAVRRVIVAGQAEQRLGQLVLAGLLAGAVGELPLPQLAHDLARDLVDLAAPVRPRPVHAVEHLREGGHAVPGLGREVRTEVEGLGVRREEDGHGPAALTGRRLHGLHVHGVDVGPLLAVDLDVHELLVHERGGRLVLEGLVGHDVAPVTRGVADRQQHGHVPPPRFLERLRRPGPPVDRVVSVLKQIRRGHTSQPVHTIQPLTRLGATGVTLTSPPRLAQLHL